jgi:hypothetical protein
VIRVLISKAGERVGRIWAQVSNRSLKTFGNPTDLHYLAHTCIGGDTGDIEVMGDIEPNLMGADEPEIEDDIEGEVDGEVEIEADSSQLDLGEVDVGEVDEEIEGEVVAADNIAGDESDNEDGEVTFMGQSKGKVCPNFLLFCRNRMLN